MADYKHDEIYRCATQFAIDQIQQCEDLEGMVITPVWKSGANDQAPYGVMLGRDGPLQTPSELLHTAQRLQGCLYVQMQLSMQLIADIDAKMKQLAAKAQEHTG